MAAAATPGEAATAAAGAIELKGLPAGFRDVRAGTSSSRRCGQCSAQQELTMRCTAFALVVFAASLTPAFAQNVVTIAPTLQGNTQFSMPSGNVECIYTPAGGSTVYKPLDGGPELSCDRRDPQYVTLTMTPKRIARIDNPGEQGCCGTENPLAYGSRVVLGPFTCDSAETGLTCKRGDGKGFSVSRAAIRTF
jgi:hypothetical protein